MLFHLQTQHKIFCQIQTISQILEEDKFQHSEMKINNSLTNIKLLLWIRFSTINNCPFILTGDICIKKVGVRLIRTRLQIRKTAAGPYYIHPPLPGPVSPVSLSLQST